MAKTFLDAEGAELPRNAPFERNGFAFAANWLDLACDDDLEKHGFTVVETAE